MENIHCSPSRYYLGGGQFNIEVCSTSFLNDDHGAWGNIKHRRISSITMKLKGRGVVFDSVSIRVSKIDNSIWKHANLIFAVEKSSCQGQIIATYIEI